LLIINDLHLGVERQAGTTKESRLALEGWMLDQFANLLKIPHEEVLILGDLFDKRNVEEHIMASVIKILAKENVTIVLGNHDLGGGADDHKLSSAEFVGEILEAKVIKVPNFHRGLYIVPHLHSQVEFDGAVSGCPDNTTMLTHCNIDSPWAHGDHSLNLSLQQITHLHSRGVKVIAAHEHAQREFDNVIVIGNQFPSSIADCHSGPKRCLLIKDGEILGIPTWDATDFSQSSSINSSSHKFVEVTGEVSIEEFQKVVKAVSTLRKNSDAFIIKNSVKILSLDAPDTVTEDVTRFNIIEMLLSVLPKNIRKEVEKCTSQE